MVPSNGTAAQLQVCACAGAEKTVGIASTVSTRRIFFILFIVLLEPLNAKLKEIEMAYRKG